MGNCLKIHLKEQVQNINLPILGNIKFYNVAGNETAYALIQPKEDNAIVKAVQGTFTVGSNSTPLTEVSIPGWEERKINLPGAAILIFSPKYTTYYNMIFEKIPIDIETLSYSDSVLLTINGVGVSSSLIKGNLYSLKSFVSTTTLIITNAPGITGNIKDISSMLSLTSIGIYDGTNVNGDWVEFARAQYALGRNNASITLNWPASSYIKFNSQTPIAAAAILAWSSATGKITFTHDGTAWEANLT